jgi:hypothetical protein
MPGKITKPNAKIWYMNRSGISNHFGVGVYGPRIDFRDSILMGSLFIVVSKHKGPSFTPIYNKQNCISHKLLI